nr:unnamed protein product [Naegleria fowleri]
MFQREHSVNHLHQACDENLKEDSSHSESDREGGRGDSSMTNNNLSRTDGSSNGGHSPTTTTNFRIDYANCNPKIKFAQQSGVCAHSIDAVLLASFVPLEKKSVIVKKQNAPLKIMDLCTGNAVIPLLLYYRLKYLAMEREEIKQQKRNRYLNSIKQQMKDNIIMEPSLNHNCENATAIKLHEHLNSNGETQQGASKKFHETCSFFHESVDERFSKIEIPCMIKGVEIQDDIIPLAQKTLELNEGSSKVIEIIHDDLTCEGFVTQAGRGKFDIVTCNPPYFRPEEGAINRSSHISIAKFEIKCNLKDVVSCAAQLLKNYGLFVMVHRACRLSDILVTLREYRLEVRRIQFVFSKSERKGSTTMEKDQHADGGEDLSQQHTTHSHHSTSSSQTKKKKKFNTNQPQQQQVNATTAVLIEAVKVQTDSSSSNHNNSGMGDGNIHSFLHVMEPLYLKEADSRNDYAKEIWNEVFSKFMYEGHHHPRE